MIWNDSPKFTEAFQVISEPIADIPPHILALIDEFVVRLYGITSDDIVKVNRARYELFHYGGKDFDYLPP